MDIWSWLQEVTILILVCKITSSGGDFLESFRPKEDNPPELNDFLNNVMEHKTDFGFVQQAARKYQKMKKEVPNSNSIDPFADLLDPFEDLNNRFKLQDKRHIPHYNVNRKFRNMGLLPPNMRNKYHRIRRRTPKGVQEPIFLIADEKSDQRFPQVIMLQEEEGNVQKRMPQPVKEVEPEGKNHLPTDIFTEPEGESLQKRSPEEIVVQSEGEKGKLDVDEEESERDKREPIDLNDQVHRTYKSNAGKNMRNDMRGNQQGDYYYVNLEKEAEKEKKIENERRRYYDTPRRSFYYPDRNPIYRRPFMGRPREDIDYPQYDSGLHHTLNDEVAFEKALSYEIEPRYQDQGPNNNPTGNNLYSVDGGRPDNVQPFYPPQNPYSSGLQNMERYGYPPQDPLATTNEKFFIDADDHLRRLETTEETSTTSSTIDGEHQKNVKQVGNGFIEITKARRDNEEDQMENNEVLSKKSLPNTEDAVEKEENLSEKESDAKDKEQSSILSKHSLHPLRVKDTSRDEEESLVQNEETDDQEDHVIEERAAKAEETTGDHFKSRKLQFFDYEIPDVYSHNEDELPSRERRDFLDALGMKNEEDYTEDNPYKDDLNVNNTDIHNDTHIGQSVTHRTCFRTTTKTTTSHQKEDIKSIKKILEEPKDVTNVPATGETKKKAEKKRAKKESSEMGNSEEEKNDIRRSRGTSEESETKTKILTNKDKIYNAHEDNRNRNIINHIKVRQEPKWSQDQIKLNNVKQLDLHKINKKEDCEGCEGNMELTEVASTTPSNCSQENDRVLNTAYEQIANQMDLENEKLAQVVNGHLASKIVSTVFDELKKKNSLKTKFYSGLSRKHVNYAGTIDFDIFKANETEDVDEARLLLDQITKVLNRLVINQVRRKLCQRLPDELKEYLDIVLNVKNTLETTNFVPNTQQGDFLFTYQEKNEPPFDVARLQEILVELEGLLLSYHNMNEECQNRAEPVKEYIEKHVKMLKQIVSCPTNHCEDKFSETKRDTLVLRDPALERQFHSVGLGRNQEFIPNFDLNQMVRNKLKSNSWKKEKKRETEYTNKKRETEQKSQQYKKLQVAAERIRDKRENEKKIAELFGGKQKRSLDKPEVDYEEPVVYSLG